MRLKAELEGAKGAEKASKRALAAQARSHCEAMEAAKQEVRTGQFVS